MNLNAGETQTCTADMRDEAAKNRCNEHALMQRISSGNELALQELIVLHGDMLARLVGRLMAWHADSDDVLQEVLLTVWRKANRFEGQGSLEGWLRRIAVNRCRNHFRATSILQRKIEQLATLLTASQSNQEDYKTSYTFAENAIDEASPLGIALRQLPTDDRAAIVLVYLEELSPDDVSETLGIKTQTLHVRLHRIKKKLKRLMTKP